MSNNASASSFVLIAVPPRHLHCTTQHHLADMQFVQHLATIMCFVGLRLAVVLSHAACNQISQLGYLRYAHPPSVVLSLAHYTLSAVAGGVDASFAICHWKSFVSHKQQQYDPEHVQQFNIQVPDCRRMTNKPHSCHRSTRSTMSLAMDSNTYKAACRCHRPSDNRSSSSE
jgi:hypothetical protein